MNRKKRIELILKKKMPSFSINVKDLSYSHKGHGKFDGSEGTHLQINIKPKKQAESRLSINKKIYSLLRAEFKSGLHSLEIKIST